MRGGPAGTPHRRGTGSDAPLPGADPLGQLVGTGQVQAARLLVRCRTRAHDRQLMAKVEIVEIQGAAPVGKRERDGLSAASAYDPGRARDGFHMALNAKI